MFIYSNRTASAIEVPQQGYMVLPTKSALTGKVAYLIGYSFINGNQIWHAHLGYVPYLFGKKMFLTKLFNVDVATQDGSLVLKAVYSLNWKMLILKQSAKTYIILEIAHKTKIKWTTNAPTCVFESVSCQEMGCSLPTLTRISSYVSITSNQNAPHCLQFTQLLHGDKG